DERPSPVSTSSARGATQTCSKTQRTSGYRGDADELCWPRVLLPVTRRGRSSQEKDAAGAMTVKMKRNPLLPQNHAGDLRRGACRTFKAFHGGGQEGWKTFLYLAQHDAHPRLHVEHDHVNLIAPNRLLTAFSKPNPRAFEAKPNQLWPGFNLLL